MNPPSAAVSPLPILASQDSIRIARRVRISSFLYGPIGSTPENRCISAKQGLDTTVLTIVLDQLAKLSARDRLPFPRRTRVQAVEAGFDLGGDA